MHKICYIFSTSNLHISEPLKNISVNLWAIFQWYSEDLLKSIVVTWIYFIDHFPHLSTTPSIFLFPLATTATATTTTAVATIVITTVTATLNMEASRWLGMAMGGQHVKGQRWEWMGNRGQHEVHPLCSFFLFRLLTCFNSFWQLRYTRQCSLAYKCEDGRLDSQTRPYGPSPPPPPSSLHATVCLDDPCPLVNIPCIQTRAGGSFGHTPIPPSPPPHMCICMTRTTLPRNHARTRSLVNTI